MTRPRAVLGQRYRAPDSPDPSRDRSVRTIQIPCPECGAGIGERCKASNGNNSAHRSRRRMAIRKGF